MTRLCSSSIGLLWNTLSIANIAATQSHELEKNFIYYTKLIIPVAFYTPYYDLRNITFIGNIGVSKISQSCCLGLVLDS